jgi:ferric-dicitrate binding protein FerR (iron transport regulator)
MDPVLRTRELARRYLDGAASAAELGELQQILQQSPAAADAFARASRLEADLLALFSEEPGRLRHTEVLAAIERHQRRRHWWVRALCLALAASLLLFLSGPLLWWLAQPEIVPPPPEGSTVLQGQVLVAGEKVQRLRDGDSFRVAGLLPALLQLSDGSRALLQPNSRVVVHGRTPDSSQRIELLSGEGRFEVTRSGDAFRVETAVGRVTALGTDFSVKLTQPDKGDPVMRTQQLLLAVMVFTGLVQVEANNGTHLLEAGQSRVFGQEEQQREQRRIATRPTGGIVVEVKDGKLTIALDRRGQGNEKTYDVDVKAMVFEDGKLGRLPDLTKGMMVRLETNDKDALVRIAAEGPTMGATVKTVADGKITLEGRGRGFLIEKDTVYPVAADARVAIDRQPAKLADVRAGARVMVKLSADRKSIVGILVMTVESNAATRARAEIKSIDEKANTITVTTGRSLEDRTLTLDKEVRVMIDGKPARLADLKAGTTVALLLDREGRTVRAVLVGSPQRGTPPIRGIVTERNKDKLTISRSGRREDAEESFDVPATAKVIVDGRPSNLEKLTKGTTVEIEKNEKGVVASIRAEGPTISGTVKSLAKGKIVLMVRTRAGDKESPAFLVPADVQVTAGRTPAKLDEVKPESLVAVKLSIDRKTVVAISLLPRRTGSRE